MDPNWQRQQMQRQQEQMRRQQEQMRKQQEQMRKQQQEQTRRQQMAAWQEQRRQQDAAKQVAPPKTGDRFAEVERAMAALRQDLAAGRVTQDQLPARLRDLMVQDAQGNWWMMAVDSNQWHRHNGTAWVPTSPPGRIPLRAGASPVPHAVPGFTAAGRQWTAPAARKRRWGWAAVLLIVGAVITLFVGNAVGEFAVDLTGGPFYPHYYWAIPVWLVGGVLTLVLAAKVWRNR